MNHLLSMVTITVLASIIVLQFESQQSFAEEQKESSTELRKLFAYDDLERYVLLPSSVHGKNQEYEIQYRITNGNSITNIAHDRDALSLIITIDSISEGTLFASIPHGTIGYNFIYDCSKDQWFILVNGEEVRYEHTTTHLNDIIKIPIEQNTEEIEIIGSWIPESQNYLRDCLNANQHKMSPMEQFGKGVLPENIVCKEGLELTFKNSNNLPACVKPYTKNKLMERGWAVS